LIFDRERPGVGKGRSAAQPDVLNGEKKFPERKHFRVFAPRRNEKVNCENDEKGWQDAQSSAGKETAELDRLPARQRSGELSADQITAQDKEKIDADPAKTIEAAGSFETEERGVIDCDDENSEGAKKVETGLAFAMRKPRIDFGRL